MLALALSLATAVATGRADTAPKLCSACDDWNAPQAPFRLHGKSFYVGPRGLAAVLIDSGDGLILLDGALPQSAEPIARNIAALGYRIEDVKWIVNSHAHFDHAGGIAALQRMSGAKVAASPRGADALRRGNAPPDDPQYGLGEEANRFAPVREVVEIGDGETITLGDITLTAHHTPGHTPGGTSWHWRSCAAGECLNLVYADSLTPVSAEDFRFSDEPARVAEFRRSIDTVRRLPCDIMVSTHPNFTGLFERQARQTSPDDHSVFVDAEACRKYADGAERWLDRRLAVEQAAQAH
ncbi:MAG: subclass B3 metallo-beta-lactamase [Rehaibacterium terrae]|uniref:subclass B3 metallo-beta-lactamase n=1 Tax=Rehaibacterium terrae TaxID=1341696 RepID=UPI00391AC9C4